MVFAFCEIKFKNMQYNFTKNTKKNYQQDNVVLYIDKLINHNCPNLGQYLNQ